MDARLEWRYKITIRVQSINCFLYIFQKRFIQSLPLFNNFISESNTRHVHEYKVRYKLARDRNILPAWNPLINQRCYASVSARTRACPMSLLWI